MNTVKDASGDDVTTASDHGPDIMIIADTPAGEAVPVSRHCHAVGARNSRRIRQESVTARRWVAGVEG